MDRARLAYVTMLTIGAGSAVIFIWWWRTRKQKHRPPSKWRKVGELSDLMVFPVKSFGPIRENSFECTLLGLRLGWLRDRTFMVTDLDNKGVSARHYPKMVQISPSFEGSVMTLRAPSILPISLDLAQLRGKNFRASLSEQTIESRDCGEEIARWLSRFLLEKDVGLRLVYYPSERPTREIRTKNKVFPYIEKDDTGAYMDETSYSLINVASVDDLNTRLEDPVPPTQFRMNFLVKGAMPLEEDHWDWIKIGNVIFRNIRPCTRCAVVTVGPETAKKHPKFEPVRTLRKYRLIDDPIVKPSVGESPAMGIHLGLKGPKGTVHLGDPIYIGIPEEKDEPLISSQ